MSDKIHTLKCWNCQHTWEHNGTECRHDKAKAVVNHSCPKCSELQFTTCMEPVTAKMLNLLLGRMLRDEGPPDYDALFAAAPPDHHARMREAINQFMLWVWPNDQGVRAQVSMNRLVDAAARVGATVAVVTVNAQGEAESAVLGDENLKDFIATDKPGPVVH